MSAIVLCDRCGQVAEADEVVVLHVHHVLGSTTQMFRLCGPCAAVAIKAIVPDRPMPPAGDDG